VVGVGWGRRVREPGRLGCGLWKREEGGKGGKWGKEEGGNGGQGDEGDGAKTRARSAADSQQIEMSLPCCTSIHISSLKCRYKSLAHPSFYR